MTLASWVKLVWKNDYEQFQIITFEVIVTYAEKYSHGNQEKE